MSRSTLLCLCAAAALSCGSALAQSAVQQTIQVTGAPQALPDAATMHAMTGDFALSDGRTLRVSRPALHLMVAVGKGWARSVEPAGPHRFASRDGRLVVQFDPGFDTLRVIENQRLTVASRGGAAVAH